MAENDRTHAGKAGPVLSYLGHPCHLAPTVDDRLLGPEMRRRLRTEAANG